MIFQAPKGLAYHFFGSAIHSMHSLSHRLRPAPAHTHCCPRLSKLSVGSSNVAGVLTATEAPPLPTSSLSSLGTLILPHDSKPQILSMAPSILRSITEAAPSPMASPSLCSGTPTLLHSAKPLLLSTIPLCLQNRYHMGGLHTSHSAVNLRCTLGPLCLPTLSKYFSKICLNDAALLINDN